MSETTTPSTQPPRIIGVAGSFAGGKDTLANYLVKEFGYRHFSTGDMLREEAMRLRGSIERPVLHEVGTSIRRQYGAGYFAQKALDKLADNPAGIVVSGLRSPGEAKAVKQSGGVLIFVDAPVELRYQRMVSRQRDQESQRTLQEFIDGEATEWYSGNTDADFNLTAIKQMADINLTNSASLDDFLRQAAASLDLQPEG